MKVSLNRDELMLLWTMFDTNGDGKLDYNEFEPIIQKDDAKSTVEPTGRPNDVRKGSQLSLRRPSMMKVTPTFLLHQDNATSIAAFACPHETHQENADSTK